MTLKEQIIDLCNRVNRPAGTPAMKMEVACKILALQEVVTQGDLEVTDEDILALSKDCRKLALQGLGLILMSVCNED